MPVLIHIIRKGSDNESHCPIPGNKRGHEKRQRVEKETQLQSTHLEALIFKSEKGDHSRLEGLLQNGQASD